jgi:hypothetical protein
MRMLLKWELGLRAINESIRSRKMEFLFQRLDSTVQFIPVMNADDLQCGLTETAG